MNFFKIRKFLRACFIMHFALLALTPLQNTTAQTKVDEKITLNVKKQSVEKVLNEITKQSGLKFFYTQSVIKNKHTIDLNVKNLPVEEVLNQITSQTRLYFTRDNNTISVTDIKESSSESGNNERKEQKDRIIKGVIVDQTGEPVIGASVVEKGTTNGTVTNIEGEFSLLLKNSTILFISFLGYESQEVSVAGKDEIRIVLKEDVQLLDEVVVVSYGTQKKRDITGSVSKIDAKTLLDMPVGQFAQKLQGQVAGVQINQVTGLPGQGMAFRIRGAASIKGGNEPLIVVDGFPVSIPLNNINPDEIETFTILKDAAATSLYGSRAANGVILITTKKGKKGKTQVGFTASYGIQQVAMNKKPDLMNAREFAQFQKELYEDKVKYDGYTGEISEVYRNPQQYGKGTDWFRELTHSAPIQNYSINIGVSKDNFSSAIIAGYFNQEGVMYNTKFERYSLRANNEFVVNDRFKIGLNISPVLQIYNNQGTDGHRNILGAALCASPILTPYNEDGSWRPDLTAPGMFPQPNWLRVLKEKIDVAKVLTLMATSYAELDIWNGIKYKLQLGTNLEARNGRTFNSSMVGGNAMIAPPQKATGSFNANFYYKWTVENMLMYTKTFGEHSVDLLAAYSAQKYTTEGNSLSGTDFPDDEISWIDAAATRNGGSSMQQLALISILGRANYSYKDKYLLQATIRRDGCSRFGTENKYANFPSVSAGWILTDEDFMKPVTTVMNYLKIRASYGLTGNYNIGNYNYLAGMVPANYILGNSLVPGKSQNRIGNSSLTWEETKQSNIGVDMGFFNDRIFLMYDYYLKRTDGLLYAIDIPVSTGFSNIESNIGDFKSWGHEITVSTKNLVNDLRWSTDFNISFNRNEVLKLGTNNAPVGGYQERNDFNRLQVGKPIGIFMGYVFDGVYMNQQEFDSQPKHATSRLGSVRMKDIDQNGVIDINDRTIIGDPNPDFIFGLTNDFTYKNFDLSIHLAGAVGGDVISWSRENHDNLDGVFNVRKDLANRWRSEENPGNGKIPGTMAGSTGLYL